MRNIGLFFRRSKIISLTPFSEQKRSWATSTMSPWFHEVFFLPLKLKEKKLITFLWFASFRPRRWKRLKNCMGCRSIQDLCHHDPTFLNNVLVRHLRIWKGQKKFSYFYQRGTVRLIKRIIDRCLSILPCLPLFYAWLA